MTVVEEQVEDTAPPMLKTNYAQISEPYEPDNHLREGIICLPNIESSTESKNPPDTPDPGPMTSEIFQNPDSTVGQGLDSSPPTHHNQYSPSNSGPPAIRDLMYI